MEHNPRDGKITPRPPVPASPDESAEAARERQASDNYYSLVGDYPAPAIPPWENAPTRTRPENVIRLRALEAIRTADLKLMGSNAGPPLEVARELAALLETLAPALDLLTELAGGVRSDERAAHHALARATLAAAGAIERQRRRAAP